jgi:hypothetical protein
MSTFFFWLLISVFPANPPYTLVVGPPARRPPLAQWDRYRRAQGHVLAVVSPPRTTTELQQLVRTAARNKGLKYLVLIGDVDAVPTGYAKAQVNILWGSDPTIATDQLYGDVNGDKVPDIAVGRIPADSTEELQAVVRKLMRYEQSADGGSWRRQLDVVAGVGGFGVMTDALIETSARSVFQQVVPASHSVRRLKTDPDTTCDQISAGSFAWIYLGHGLPTMLDLAATPRGPRPILATSDIPKLHCGANCPLAVLIACYTGAIDAGNDSLGEELLLREKGPVAVIAATRVTMPYGNSVFGCELLRATFRESPGTLGDIWLQAQVQTLAAPKKNDSLRTSLDAVARGVSPAPADLAAERREHVLLYQLLGDPLLRLNFPAGDSLPTPRIAVVPDELRSR